MKSKEKKSELANIFKRRINDNLCMSDKQLKLLLKQYPDELESVKFYINKKNLSKKQIIELFPKCCKKYKIII